MTDKPGGAGGGGGGARKPPKPGGLLGSLKDALAAASRDDTGAAIRRMAALPPPPPPPAVIAQPAQPAGERGASGPPDESGGRPPAAPLSAAEAAREARGMTLLKPQDGPMDLDGTNTTRIARTPRGGEPPGAPRASPGVQDVTEEAAPARTQVVRGRQPLRRGQFLTDPVVGWFVVVGGPGLGSYRPIFEGNNTIGRLSTNRIALDFGDEAISAEEQAYVRYDSTDRSFLLVPNMSKTNVVSLNTTRPTAAVELKPMDVVTMGRTQLVFMPFCGPDFDWSEISESKD